MWTLLQPGDAALVPCPCYPIHIYGPLLRRRRHPRGADVGPATTRSTPHRGLGHRWPKPRVIVMSFPHNPTTAVRRPRVHAAGRRLRPREGGGRRPRLRLRRHRLRRLPAAVDPAGRGRQGVRRRALLDDQVVLDGRLAGRVPVRQREVVQALAKLKSYLDYGTFQPIQIAATVTLNEASDYPEQRPRDLPVAPRRALRRARPHRLGGRPARAGRCSCGRRSPSPTAELGSVEFASLAGPRGEVAVSPGIGFGPGGEGHVRFALIENEQRIGQAVRNLRRGLDRLHELVQDERART